MKKTIEEKLKEITLRVTRMPDAEFSGRTTFDDLEADSMDKVQILIALEEEFGIEIPDEEIISIETMGAFVEYILEKIAAKEKASQD